MGEEREGETKKLSFAEMGALERFNYLSKFEDPAKKLKNVCRDIEPGTIFNQEGLNQTPSVLLVGAYEPTDLPAGRFNAPPFGLQRLASFLRGGGVNADLIDVSTRGKVELFDLLKRRQYDFIGFSVLGPTLPNDIQLTHEVKRLCPSSTLVVGGMVPTANPDLLEKSAADYLILGYGEDSFFNLVTETQLNLPTDKLAGVWKRKKSGVFQGGRARPVGYQDLKVYSFLLDSTVGLETTYTSPSGLYRGLSPSRLKTYRFIGQGFCPRTCTFCATRNFLRLATGENRPPYISLDGEDRFKIVKGIQRTLPKMETIYINDDDFFTDRKMARDFFQRVINAKRGGEITADLNFICSARIDEVDDETLGLAKRAGVILVNFGVESFHPEGLKSLRKLLSVKGDSTPEFIASTIDRVLEAGITPSVNLIVFYPEISWEHLHENIIRSVDLLERGGELNLGSYVRFYHGADILADKTIPRLTYGEPIIPSDSGKPPDIFWQDTLLLPKDKKMREFAKRVIVRRSRLEEGLKRDYGWSHRRAPHQVVQLCFLKALTEEAEKSGYMDRKTSQPLLTRMNKLIQDSFSKLGAETVSPNSKIETDFPTVSLSPEYKKEAISLKQKLLAAGLKEDEVKLFFNLRTHLFCDLWGRPEFLSIREYLQYLFFGEEKSRFFHLDDFDRFIVVEGALLGFMELSEDQKDSVRKALGLDKENQEKRREFELKLKALIKKGIWRGPDDEGVFSEKILELLQRL